MPEVSVFMPCYNAERTIREALSSIAAQTHPDFEVLALDSLFF
ncbi:MAG: glycosyltransferase, partial [Anaerolineales bacterium]|nr:glycosyltransferase [Anaerolineales bacterium]